MSLDVCVSGVKSRWKWIATEKEDLEMTKEGVLEEGQVPLGKCGLERSRVFSSESKGMDCDVLGKRLPDLGLWHQQLVDGDLWKILFLERSTVLKKHLPCSDKSFARTLIGLLCKAKQRSP